MKKRTVALLCAAVMLLGVVFGGTMAWLSKGSKPLVNTFKAGDIVIELTETDRTYVMAPGTRLPKDPTVSVKVGSEDCYLFVKVEESENSPVEWKAADGWHEVPDVENVFYRVFSKKKPDVEATDGKYLYPFLSEEDGIVGVNIPADLKKTDMDAFKDNKPTLTFTAYAIQKDWLAGSVDLEGDYLTENEIAQIWQMVQSQGVPAEKA